MTLTENQKFVKFGLKTEMCSSFYETWYLEQIGHGDYELIMNWNWWSWPKIVDSDKYGPNIEIRFDFYEIWHSQKIEHTFYNVILASV